MCFAKNNKNCYFVVDFLPLSWYTKINIVLYLNYKVVKHNPTTT